MPSLDLKTTYKVENLLRAWKWLNTSLQHVYKNHYRHILQAYSISIDSNLSSLSKRLIDDTYQPHDALKVYEPKKSATQRAITLLTLEDQIVYQALANTIAEHLAPVIRKRYFKTVFGNLYTRPHSKFFYEEWRKTYSKFSQSIVKAFKDGYRYTATFDLAACYDSIDHAVLKHFLDNIGLSKEFGNFLCNLLSRWTKSSIKTAIYHGHGIPQGPLASGLISECVLRYFDENDQHSRKIKYFRYVDDIRLFAKSEGELRSRILRLDLRSKEIGLFPQSSKIDIHPVRRIEDEIKSVSQPPEPGVDEPHKNQPYIHSRLRNLSRNLSVDKRNETRFKFILSKAVPTAATSLRLSKIVRSHPHLYRSVFWHIARCTTQSKKSSEAYLKLLREETLYPGFSASLIASLNTNIHTSSRESFNKLCFAWTTGKKADSNDELRAELIRVCLQQNLLTFKQVEDLIFQESWWVKSFLARDLREDHFGSASTAALLNKLVREKSGDVAIVASEQLIIRGYDIDKPIRGTHMLAQNNLKSSGLVGKVLSSTCPISETMSELVGNQLKEIDWKDLLGTHYQKVLRLIVTWKGYAETNASSWVNLTDTINDLVTSALFGHDSHLGVYKVGEIGKALYSSGPYFKNNYPAFYRAVKTVHDKRLESNLSHPVTRKTNRVTRVIQFREIKELIPCLRKGYLEVWNNW